jgi:hypothetical protein
MDGVPHPDNMRGNGVYTFERCLLDPVSRRLVRDGVQIKLPARLFETLLYMVENPGRPIDREELMSAVWRDRTVDDANLRRAVSSLRQALSAAGVDDSLIIGTRPRLQVRRPRGLCRGGGQSRVASGLGVRPDRRGHSGRRAGNDTACRSVAAERPVAPAPMSRRRFGRADSAGLCVLDCIAGSRIAGSEREPGGSRRTPAPGRGGVGLHKCQRGCRTGVPCPRYCR